MHFRPLLDAAHVTAGRDPKSEVDVSEGIALCATHHRAFDTGVLTFDRDYNVRIHVDEPTLRVYDGKHLVLPADEAQWPRV
jgi:putative restriction endonuclease